MFPKSLRDLFLVEYLIYITIPISVSMFFCLISIFNIVSLKLIIFVFIIPVLFLFAIFLLFLMIDKSLNQTKDIFKLTWYIVEVNEFDFKTIDQWCSENLESKHKFIYKQKSGGCVYAIKKELDVMAFKLRWI